MPSFFTVAFPLFVVRLAHGHLSLLALNARSWSSTALLKMIKNIVYTESPVVERPHMIGVGVLGLVLDMDIKIDSQIMPTSRNVSNMEYVWVLEATECSC